MSKFLDKFLITTAVGKRHTKDLSCEHISTSNFMTFNVAYYRNLVPKEKIEVNFRAFARLAAMPVPTFGRANMNCRCFFVPFRTVMPSWNDFITDSVHTFSSGTSSIPELSRGVKSQSLAVAIRDYSESVGSPSEADFTTVSGGVYAYFKFSPFSRRIYKLLLSLGYALNFNFDGENPTLSALPLLALMKVYLDWYWPSAYVGDPDYVAIDAILRRDVGNDIITANEVLSMFNWLDKVCYDSDYFVSAFDNPAGPTSGLSSSVSILDSSLPSSSNSNSAKLASNGTPILNRSDSTATNVVNLSQYALDALKRLTDYMKRHQLAGARSLDRYLSRFGVTLSAEKMNRSVYLGCHTIPLMTGDVMGTANTYEVDGTKKKGSPIGAYAGKGFLVGQDGHFEFETDEYGLFFIVYSIIPEVGYYQGIDRHNMHISRLDFFTPEFDAMGTRAISSAEALMSTHPTNSAWQNVYSSVFGYCPQYAEYKVGRDWLTGDYRIPTMSEAGETSDSWHLFRDLNDNAIAPLVHSRSFVTSGTDDEQYSRIFYNTENRVDHFFLHFFFGVKSTAPMKPLYDDYDFDNDEGEKRVLDVNGVKMN